ncbi:hypothetical protein LTR78_001287 [Recurvomyces mirabilis]|uniref:Uncharacterized protein n=1 Tax=Recurvomyces mirabilis TaxID=574656 RepID=A0AAE0WVZ2_9PEZI|nr:hypothetical protein LTR78_001287 [Recurvomyces mirabilis]KAK5161264.1 hypothetical protein LTS14_001060 [Recurvomyces mirabilis]
MSLRSAISLPLRQILRQAIPSRSFHHRTPLRPREFLLRRPQRRHASFTSNARALFRQNPVSVSLALLALTSGIAALVYTNYLYQYYILRAFHNYPEYVAKKLRRALYFTNTDLQPQEALKYYKQALQIAEEVGMDPFSDEIIGVKVQVAKLMEDVRQPAKAVQVLEILRRDCLEWMKQLGGLEKNRVKRTRVLAKVVAVTVKLGELYGSPEIYDRELAEERLVWAVETVLKERVRRDGIRRADGLSEEALCEREGVWMTDSETGAALERLAASYEEKDLHYLASPLFLQALSLYPTKDCHTVILMNNLASSLAQQSPRAASAVSAQASSSTIATTPPAMSTTAPATRESMVQNARLWAQKALDVASSIQPPVRNEECDIGCAVATHNLAEFAEMLGQRDEAGRLYAEAKGIAKAIGFAEGVEMSESRLKAMTR